MIVISDTSAILNLARIGRLEILRTLFNEVVIPSAVFAELTTYEAELGGVIGFAAIPWLTRASATNVDRVRELATQLDPGEAEAIALAFEREAALLIVDERRARRVAVAAGIRVVGLLGVLARAKREGILKQVKPILDELIREAGFWVSADLYQVVLKEMEEE